MSKKVKLVLSDNEAGEISLGLQDQQIQASENGDGLRAYRLGMLLDKVNHERWEAAK